SLSTGTNFTRILSTIASEHPDPLTVGIGLCKRPNNFGQSAFFQDRQVGAFSAWGATDPDHGNMGVAVLVDPTMISDVVADADNYLVLLNVRPGQQFGYSIGAAWDRGLDFHSRDEWEAYVRAEAAARSRPR